MTNLSQVFRVGTRKSKLALIQTKDAIERISEHVSDFRFEIIPFSSPGDRDKQTDLRNSPPDFFTRDLDNAVISGKIDFAVHSAKDLPTPIPSKIDWCWLPWREDPRDVLVLPAGKGLSSLPPSPRIGVSSARREVWCRKKFPTAKLLSIRGDIESRIAQLDGGLYDAVIMASAALIRLGLQNRISEWIPEEELKVPDGQGVLAITFRAGDLRMLRFRSFFVKAVIFAGAGAGRTGVCTLETINSLKNADVCIHDALIDNSILEYVNKKAVVINAGKRCGSAGIAQEIVNELIALHARRGERVVRLKGGDPGIFGRLAEEIEYLESLNLPYRILPGVSSLITATTGTGLLLTQRGKSRGFIVATPRVGGGRITRIDASACSKFSKVFFMATKCIEKMISEFQEDGIDKETPCAVVYDAGSANEVVIMGSISNIIEKIAPFTGGNRPGLFIIGDAVRHRYVSKCGALRGKRVLLTCSDSLQKEAEAAVFDFGGVPLHFPMIRLVPIASALDLLKDTHFDWLVVTSPSAVNAMVTIMKERKMDLRILPKIIACGRGTASALEEHGLIADATPKDNFGSDSLAELTHKIILPGQRVLRIRSDAAGDTLASSLRKNGIIVEDVVIMRNEPITYKQLPSFDAVFFASSSAVTSFMNNYGLSILQGRKVVVIGKPTAEKLKQNGIFDVLIGREATVYSSIESLATECISSSIKEGD